MGLQEIIDERKISKYKLSKQSGVPYSTICDICTGKSDIRKSSAETVARIAHVLEMDFTELIGELDYPEAKKKAAKKTADKESLKSSKVKTAEKKETAKDKKKTGKNKPDSKDKAASGISETNESAGNVKISGSADRHADRRVQIDAEAQNAYAQKKEEAYKAYCKDLEDKKNEMGELAFLVAYLKNNEVEILYNLNRKRESIYLLKIVDELCVKYNFPLCKEYEEIRKDMENN